MVIPRQIYLAAPMAAMLAQPTVVHAEKQYAGTIVEISENRMKLELKTGSTIHIGFLCKPEICRSASVFRPDEYIIAEFGSVENKNELLSLRLCLDEDEECADAENRQEERRKQHRLDTAEHFDQMRKCETRMELELKSDERYIGENWFSRLRTFGRDVSDQYYEMQSDPNVRRCAQKISTDHLNAFIDACEKNSCGDRVGGGCHHLAMTATTDEMMMEAIDRCN